MIAWPNDSISEAQIYKKGRQRLNVHMFISKQSTHFILKTTEGKSSD